MRDTSSTMASRPPWRSARVVGTLWSGVAMLASMRHGLRPARRSPSNACGEVTSWRICRSMYISDEPSSRRLTSCISQSLSYYVLPAISYHSSASLYARANAPLAYVERCYDCGTNNSNSYFLSQAFLTRMPRHFKRQVTSRTPRPSGSTCRWWLAAWSYPMDLANLNAFITVAELGGFSVAAERLHLTQPAVSKRIAGLEQQLGVRLFDRLGREISLTEAGRALLPRAY